MTRILLVEDSPTQAELAKVVLEDAGFEVTVRLDPRQALAAIDERAPDVVVTDVMMPVISGYELCRRIKSTHPELPVMVLTTLDDPVEIFHALECGADSFIQKAHGTRELPARIENLLSSRAARAQRASDQGVEVHFLGRKLTVESGRERILDLLISTFEDAVRSNRALGESMAKLSTQHEALMRSEQMRAALSASIVHDLKSPAAGLMMLAMSRLRKASLSADEQRSWRMVQATAETCQRMALNLLDVARREDGVLRAERAEVDLGELIGEVRSIVESLAEDREHVVEVGVDPSVRTVRIDRSLISRLILNLADNAIRHTPRSGRITIAASRARDGALELRVINDGEPIPPALREKIFDRYARLEHADADTGRGLGLWFCRIASEAHGGSIGVVDDARGATCFLAQIPEA